MSKMSADLTIDQRNLSIGIEVRSPIKDHLFDWFDAGLISHVQVTLPNIIARPDLESIWQNIPTILHSNLLNVMGTNEFDDLALIAKKISDVPCNYIIEHFTLFREKNHKYGLCPAHFLDDSKIQLFVDNVNKWKILTGKQIALENIPITDSVEKYFELLIRISKETESPIVCDIPHLLISASAAKWDETELLNIARQLKPIQIHVSGLSQSGALLTDNHKSFDPILLSIGRQLFPEVRHITIEQDGAIAHEIVEDWLQGIKSGSLPAVSVKTFLDKLVKLETPTIYDQNKHLSREALSLIGGLANYQQNLSAAIITGSTPTALTLLDQLTPFVSPLSVLQAAISEGRAEKAISLASAICVRASSLATWLELKEAKNYQISFGESAITKFSYKSNSEWPSTFHLEHCEKLKFSGEAFWLEIATPKLS